MAGVLDNEIMHTVIDLRKDGARWIIDFKRTARAVRISEQAVRRLWR
ncbi:MAG: hypothetical protein ACREV4_06785 [Gammaproteobacteria bacterium]